MRAYDYCRSGTTATTPPLDDVYLVNAPVDVSDDVRRFAGRVQAMGEGRRLLGGDDDDDTDSHVEGSEHLRIRHLAALLNQREYGWDRPGPALDGGAAVDGKDPRDVVVESAARDVRHALDVEFAQKWHDRRSVAAVDRQQLLRERARS